MSTTDGARSPEQDGEARVVQICPRVSQDTAAYCPLQVSSSDTSRMVIHNAVVTLGLDSSRAYSLLEVKESGREEIPLDDGECPLERVLLWPPNVRKWHPKIQGYYFVLKEQESKSRDQSETRTQDYDDLCSLPSLTEESILEALRRRFYKNKIYTYASNILFAVNPNKFLPVYYNPKYVKMYENQPLGKLSPHIFAVADAAFRAMLNRQANQCIVISGESSSGKTQSSSYLVHCLTALSQNTSSRVERTILGAGPVLEAFGNARTADNNNSSRFGKFIQLNYLESGVIRGAVIEKYLLEKSRLVSRDKNERNYHVFYYLLMGSSRDEQKEFHLLKPQDYLYLKQDDLHLEHEKKFGHEYKRLHQAMEMVGFLPSTKKHIFSILSAILHLGNVRYTQQEDSQVLQVGPADVVSTLSDLLKVKEEQLVSALTKRRVVTVNATIVSQYTLQEASLMRDSMAKSLYSALFDWILLHINHAMLNRRDMEESLPCLSIGVLDMFGFENLDTNSFEQLCINYTNEMLQFYINHKVFTRDQEDYMFEGIEWENIEFTDNNSCVQLISAEPSGLFHLLDDTSNHPQATDETLLDRLNLQHRHHPFFLASPEIESTFVIKHFAGRVKYHIKDFLKKNLEHMRPEVISLLRSSERAFLHHLASSSPEALFRWGVLRATIRILAMFKHLGRQRAELMEARRSQRKPLKDIKQHSSQVERLSSNSTTLDFSFDHSDEHPLEVFEDIFDNYEQRNRKSKTGRQKQLIPKNLMNLHSLQRIVGLTAHSPTNLSIFHPHQKTKPLTVSAQFQVSLGKLKQTIDKAELFFIFCIRSNAENKELHFDEELVEKQIKYMGILQIVQMQKSGYSAKYTFKEFFEKFKILLPPGATANPEQITELFERMQLEKSAYQIGKTKVLLKQRVRQRLQDARNKEMIRHIIVLQRWVRGCLMKTQDSQRREASDPSQHQQEAEDKEKLQVRPGRESLTKRELKRQNKVEGSPNRAQLNRPLSLPLDTSIASSDQDSPSKASSLQRYKDMGGIKEKAVKWKEKQGEGEPTDDSSPEVRHRRQNKNAEYLCKAKSMSADELSRISLSGSESSPTNQEVQVRLRKQKKRKRRLAGTHSRLVRDFVGSKKETEYWSFPLPPMSPSDIDLKTSASTEDVRTLKSQVKSELDGGRYSLPAGTASDDSQQHESNQSQLTGPERLWFLSKFLRWRPAKSPPSSDSHSDRSVTLSSYTPATYHSSNSGRPTRNPTIRISRATRALELDSSLDRVIHNPTELQNLDEFLGNQVNVLRGQINKLSPNEIIFLNATMQFRDTIKDMYSVQKSEIAYKDLMKGYHHKVNSLAGPNKKSEVLMVVNHFRSLLDGFIIREKKRGELDPPKAPKSTKTRRKKDKCPDNPLDHLFSTYLVNVMQSCDLCGSNIWVMDKAYMCSACKLICHKRCLSKIITHCSTRRARQNDGLPGSLHFGVEVCVLTSKANPVPKVVEQLLMHVEINGLYTEGIYRKSGSACRARELHQILEIYPESAHLDDYPIHTITGLVKRWLRELPDPLMTFSLYSDFLHAVEMPEKCERIRAVYQKVDELPPANYNTLERLIFHLVRVAKEEEHNKMSSSSLAIVFAPCILRSPDSDDPFLSMRDVSKTTRCVEILITEQLRRYNEKMQNIQKLEDAEALAVNQLKLKRQNTVVEQPSELKAPERIPDETDERTLIERIKSIKQEKVDLACRLPDLEPEHSSENTDSSSLTSTESLEDQLHSLDLEGTTAPKSKMQKPETPYKPPGLAQRIRRLMAQREIQQNELTSQPKTDDTQSQYFYPGQENPSSNVKTLNGSFDDLDIPYIDDDEDLS